MRLFNSAIDIDDAVNKRHTHGEDGFDITRIIQGNTSIQIIDPGTGDGYIVITEDGVEIGRFTGEEFGLGCMPNEKLTVKGILSLKESTPPDATADYGKFYVKPTDNLPYFKTSGGAEYGLTGGGYVHKILKEDTSIEIIDNSGGYITVTVDGTEIMRMVDTGVGIGTAILNERLTVAGNLSLKKGTVPEHTTDYGKFYVKSSNGLPYFKTDIGTEYGLTGSGYEYTVTTKTAAGINTAIDLAFAAGGGTVLLSSGEYDCTGTTQVVMKDNVTLSGYGATLKGDGGLSHIIYGSGLDNAKILGIAINGQLPASSSANGETGIHIATGNNITIQDCYIYDMGSRGTWFDGVNNAIITNSHIKSCYQGIGVGSNGQRLRFIGNHVEDTYAGGITLYCASDGTIADITIANNLVDYSNVSEVELAQPIVCYSGYSGATSGTIRGITVTGNNLIGKGNGHAAIRMGGNHINISGNTMYNFGDGILIRKTNTSYIFYSSHITIAGNTLKHIASNGIDLDVVKRVSITGNVIEFIHSTAADSGIALGQNHGSLSYPNLDITITGNTLTGTPTTEYGIFVNCVDRVTINGNTISTVSKDGIRIVDSTYVNCEDNIVYDTGNGSVGYGIYLAAAGSNASDYIIVANNQLNGNPDGALTNSSAGTHIKTYNNHGNDDYLGGSIYDDNDHLYLGTDNDFDMYHSGANTYIKNTTGAMIFYGNSSNIGLNITSSPAVALIGYYNNAEKIRTIDTGIQITGKIDLNGGNIIRLGNTHQADNKHVYLGGGNDLDIYHTGTSGYIMNKTGSLNIYATSTILGITLTTSVGAVILRYNGAEKLRTTNTGITVTGSCSGCDYVFEDNYKLLSLDKLNKFVKEKEHLPGLTIARGKEIEFDKMRQELVVKVEEQALYILQLHKRLKTLENYNKRLDKSL